MQIVLKNEDGSENYTAQINYFGEPDFLDALQLKLLKAFLPNRPSKNMPVRYISMRNMQRYWSEKEKTRSVSRLMLSIKSSTKGIQVMIRQMHRSRQLPVSSITYTHIHWKVRFILYHTDQQQSSKFVQLHLYTPRRRQRKEYRRRTGSME